MQANTIMEGHAQEFRSKEDKVANLEEELKLQRKNQESRSRSFSSEADGAQPSSSSESQRA
jgi:hypothetical protein